MGKKANIDKEDIGRRRGHAISPTPPLHQPPPPPSTAHPRLRRAGSRPGNQWESSRSHWYGQTHRRQSSVATGSSRSKAVHCLHWQALTHALIQSNTCTRQCIIRDEPLEIRHKQNFIFLLLLTLLFFFFYSLPVSYIILAHIYQSH
jgi:hypothetical protein